MGKERGKFAEIISPSRVNKCLAKSIIPLKEAGIFEELSAGNNEGPAALFYLNVALDSVVFKKIMKV